MLNIISLTTKIYIEWSHLILEMFNINIVTSDVRSHNIELDFFTEISYWSVIF